MVTSTSFSRSYHGVGEHHNSADNRPMQPKMKLPGFDVDENGNPRMVIDRYHFIGEWERYYWLFKCESMEWEHKFIGLYAHGYKIMEALENVAAEWEAEQDYSLDLLPKTSLGSEGKQGSVPDGFVSGLDY